MTNSESAFDVVILGGGLAGLTLARHLLLDTDKTILVVERRDEIPGKRQKVGESSVQVGGYYYSRVLDLEEYLWRNHYMKYNLRFYWPSAGRDNSRFEDYAQAFIRKFSNIPSYQLDRNVFEADVLRMNQENPRFRLRTSASKLDVDLRDDGPHRVRFETPDGQHDLEATWVVDTTGRHRFLAKRDKLARGNSIRHASFFWWVDGLVDVDRLTDLDHHGVRKKKERRHQGHLPSWLATNHFCAEGLWFWVIPLQGKTSLGLVFDKDVVDFDTKDVNSVEKATRWVCESFPCFARDLPQREVLDFGGFKDYSYDCAQTIDAKRWAIAGEAGRFSDPLYSPGSDLIAIYNTLIVDAITTDDDELLRRKCLQHEQTMRAVYQAYVPTYDTSYDVLGDCEAFTLKYTWELTIYFALYVFPFINDLFTDRRFMLTYMRLFTRLGRVNQNVQRLLSAYYQWKKEHCRPRQEPVFHDFMDLGPLAGAEKTFYEVGVSVEEAKAVLSRQVESIEELGRFIAAWICSVVIGDERVLVHGELVRGLDAATLEFDPAAIRERFADVADVPGEYAWSFDPHALEALRPERLEMEVAA